MNINLGIRFDHPSAIAVKARYARIDNVLTPVWKNVSPNPTTSPAIIKENIENGQYRIELTPVYADGRVCQAEVVETPSCIGLTSINAFIQGGNLVVQYVAPSSVPKVRITVDYPNAGSWDDLYVNNGNDISIPLPTNVEGTFYVQGQSVCDEVSGFYSPMSNSVSVLKVTTPSITQTSEENTGSGGTRTQVFTIGNNVAIGNRFVLETYSHKVTVVAVTGDTPSSIAGKLRDGINNTTAEAWNDHGGAPATGTPGFKPTATSSGSQVIAVLNFQNSFAATAYNS